MPMVWPSASRSREIVEPRHLRRSHGNGSFRGNSVGRPFCTNPDFRLSHLPVVEAKNAFHYVGDGCRKVDLAIAPAIFLIGGFVGSEIDGERFIHLCDRTLEHYRSARNAGFDDRKPICGGERGNAIQIVLRRPVTCSEIFTGEIALSPARRCGEAG